MAGMRVTAMATVRAAIIIITRRVKGRAVRSRSRSG